MLDPYLNEQQHGFRNGRSTTTNLMIFTSFILCEMQKGFSVDAIYTDFSKAFDRVDHGILIKKLKKYGISGPILSWISSYLSERSQIVKFQGRLSKTIKVLSGVPQGSHLGPLLFLIFISDLSIVLNDVDHLLFADDLKIYKSISNPADAEFLQNKINVLYNWCSKNKLVLNVGKCNVITFSRKNKKNIAHYEYIINKTKLSRVDNILDLGIVLDYKLLYISHFDMIIGKANQLLGFIKRRAKEFNNVWVTKTLYCSLVRSILEYGCIIWDPDSETQSKRLESIQKQFLLFALRNLFDPRDYVNLPSYNNRLKILGLTSLSHRRKVNTACFVFDVLSENINVEFISNRITLNQPIRTTRHTNFLVQYNHRTYYALNEPINRCSMTFNSFSHLYHQGISKNSFKSLILQNM